MTTRVTETLYKDVKCITLENSNIRVAVIPESGGKMQSLYDITENYEHLYQSPGSKFIRPIYGAKFEECEFSGFDDMFPNVLSCTYPDFPWKGIEMPDHGEVWTQAFEYEIKDKSVALSCRGIRFPYTFFKEISINERTVSIDYLITNHSDYSFKYIWAAHPLKNIDNNSEILLPSEVKEIMYTFGGLNEPSVFGDIADLNDESSNTLMSSGLNKCKKYYVLGRAPLGECALYNNTTYRYMKFSYPKEKVPYLGVWINNDGYYKQRNVALEPCTAAPDAIDMADTYGWVSIIEPLGSVNWRLSIEIGCEKDKKKIIQ